MTDYRKLEERLRQIADYEVIGNNKQAQVGALRDAADAIVALQVERDTLRVRVKELEVELARLQDKINPPRAHYERP